MLPKEQLVIGRMAYKNKGFFSGIYGVIELNLSGHSNYVLVYKDGSKNGFNQLSEITIVENKDIVHILNIQ